MVFIQVGSWIIALYTVCWSSSLFRRDGFVFSSYHHVTLIYLRFPSFSLRSVQ